MANTNATQEDWLKTGMELFSETGIKGLKVEKISHRLGLPSSEFFTHFQDEDDFLHQMLQYWRHSKTTTVVERFNREPVERRLERLVDSVFADRNLSDSDFLFYLRRLGRDNKEIAQFVAEVEEERIIPTRTIFNGLGFGLKEIDLKVELLYNFYLGWYERYKYEEFTPELRSQVMAQLRQLLGLGS